jgi:maleate isomerase
MWRADGWEAKWRLGVLTPLADRGPESELNAMAPPEIGVHAARVPFAAMAPGGTMEPTIPLAPVRAFAEPPHIDEATEALAMIPIQAIGVGFTSSAYVIGAQGEEAMLDRLRARANGLPVVATGEAAVRALRTLGSRRVALVDPPWFDAELNSLGRAYYESAGFEVVFSSPCGLPSDQSLIQPGELFDWVVAHVTEGADAVMIGGNGFRAVGVIEALESKLGRPVLTANQVLLWAMLGAAGATVDITGYGRLFAGRAPGRI